MKGEPIETAIDAGTDTDEAGDPAELAKRYGSCRGRFEIFHAPEIRHPPSPEQVADADLSGAADAFDYSSLLDNHDEEDVRNALTEMMRAITPGSAVTLLFAQQGREGMSLGHAWFGPNFPLFRHSHPKYGDCLYYVLAGEVIMGSRVLKAGDGFFVPNGMPYKYRAGPEGVEVLEFRAGGGVRGAPAMKLDETSLAAIERITDTAKAHQPEWDPPRRVANSPLYQ